MKITTFEEEKSTFRFPNNWYGQIPILFLQTHTKPQFVWCSDQTEHSTTE